MTRRVMSPAEVSAWLPFPLPTAGHSAIDHTRQRMARAGQWAPWQMIGRRMAIGCVALEITQRCNLDCSYCYLSESSEALKDIPLEEIFRRIDLIHAHYGDGTDVQITGGEPTLRRRDDLLAIVQRIRLRRMRSSLFTNGIKATRELLAVLAAAGLEDVAFHVDMTQQRPGYASEIELNALREEYIGRAHGLPLAVIFNTTVFPGNVHAVPDIARFFVQHAGAVRFASFQIGADTGRGVARERVTVNPDTIKAALCEGAGTELNFGAASAGHAQCNGYAYGLVINGRVHDFFNEPDFVHEILASSAHLRIDRARKYKVWLMAARYLFAHPHVLARAASRLSGLLWRQRADLIAARGRVQKISFFVHNFMDASQLDHERCDACAFMVMTPDGPLSMCVHNAKRDNYLLVPAIIPQANRLRYFNPATGLLEDSLPDRITVSLNRKNARGRAQAVEID